jgi:hypothetical protein
LASGFVSKTYLASTRASSLYPGVIGMVHGYERGGVNGRKVTFISLDDAYSPPKAVERVRPIG